MMSTDDDTWDAIKREREREWEEMREKPQQSALFGSEHGECPGKCLVLINITIFTTFRLS